MTRRIILLAAASLLLIAVSWRAAAQTPLIPFAAVDGQIEAGATDSYTFDVEATSVYSFIVESTSQDFDPVLSIEDAQGNLIVSNDDYRYPDSRDALLEAITFTAGGEYRAVVRGFGETTGGYTITMLPGYANLTDQDTFASAGGWVLVGEGVESASARGGLQLALEGVGLNGAAYDPDDGPITNFYAEVVITEAAGVNTWAAGMALRYTTGGYYQFLIDADGRWRFAVVRDGSVRVIADWTANSAIVPDLTPFRLGVLASGQGFDLFFNTRWIGQVVDGSLSGPGRVGLAVASDNVSQSETIITFDDQAITQPLLIDGERVFPAALIRAGRNAIIDELERRGAIPYGGQIALNVDTSFIDNSVQGVFQQPLGRGTLFRAYVMGTTVRLEQSGVGLAGCGLLLRSTGEDDYTVAFLDNVGGYGLSQRQGSVFLPGVYGENFDFDVLAGGDLLAIVDEDNIWLYINGLLVGQLSAVPVEGGVGNVLINFDAADSTCQFADTWLWRFG